MAHPQWLTFSSEVWSLRGGITSTFCNSTISRGPRVPKSAPVEAIPQVDCNRWSYIPGEKSVLGDQAHEKTKTTKSRTWVALLVRLHQLVCDTDLSWMSLRNLLLTEPTQFQDRQEKTSLGDSWQQELPMGSGAHLYLYAGLSSSLITVLWQWLSLLQTLCC